MSMPETSRRYETSSIETVKSMSGLEFLGSGLVGSEVCQKLVQRGENTTAIVNPSNARIR